MNYKIECGCRGEVTYTKTNYEMREVLHKYDTSENSIIRCDKDTVIILGEDYWFVYGSNLDKVIEYFNLFLTKDAEFGGDGAIDLIVLIKKEEIKDSDWEIEQHDKTDIYSMTEYRNINEYFKRCD